MSQINYCPYEVVHSPKDLLYVGWTDPGEWFNLTVNVKESGLYNVSLLYTAKTVEQFRWTLMARMSVD
jgi:hypothetical protein